MVVLYAKTFAKRDSLREIEASKLRALAEFEIFFVLWQFLHHSFVFSFFLLLALPHT